MKVKARKRYWLANGAAILDKTTIGYDRIIGNRTVYPDKAKPLGEQEVARLPSGELCTLTAKLI